jgi:hypothetical protein
LLQKLFLEDGVSLSVRQLLEVLGSLYVLGDKLHVGAPSRREPSFCL